MLLKRWPPEYLNISEVKQPQVPPDEWTSTVFVPSLNGVSAGSTEAQGSVDRGPLLDLAQPPAFYVRVKKASLPQSSEMELALVQHLEKHQMLPGLTMFIGFLFQESFARNHGVHQETMVCTRSDVLVFGTKLVTCNDCVFRTCCSWDCKTCDEPLR